MFVDINGRKGDSAPKYKHKILITNITTRNKFQLNRIRMQFLSRFIPYFT